MKYYFAGRYSWHSAMREFRDELVQRVRGAEVTSRWIDLHQELGGLSASYNPQDLNAHPELCWPFGEHDFLDILDSDAIVSFSADGGKGGRHVEHGIALMLNYIRRTMAGINYRIILIGEREHIFHTHPATEVYPNWQRFLAMEDARFNDDA